MAPHVLRYNTRSVWLGRWNAWMGYAIEAHDAGLIGEGAYWLDQCSLARRMMASV